MLGLIQRGVRNQEIRGATLTTTSSHSKSNSIYTNKQVAENGERITDLDRKTEKGISQAQSSADEANQAASKAQQSAADARDWLNRESQMLAR